MESKRGRRNLLFALPLVVAVLAVGYVALSGIGRVDGSDGTVPRWELASEIANSRQDQGTPRGLAECIGERAVISTTREGLERMWRDPEYRQTRGDVEAVACERSYVGPRKTPDTGPIAIDPQASPARFAQSVDAICAVDFNQALGQEAEIEAAAPGRKQNQDRVEATVAAIWAGSQAETARLVANLGNPPSDADTVERWRQNVAERGRMFGEKGDALKRGESARAEQILERIMVLKEEADRLGDSFGLRVCTSN